MEHAVSGALETHSVARAPALSVLYRDAEGAWQSLPRPAFRRLVRSGDAGPGTVLLDVTAATVGDLRHGGIERQARDTWAARAFALAA